MKKNKKAEWKINPGLAWFVLIVVVIILTMYVGSWECLNNSYCDKGEICTSQHVCYKPISVENEIVKLEYRYTLASVILGLSIIVAAYILSNKRIFNKK